jgi:hypothetical protein
MRVPQLETNELVVIAARDDTEIGALTCGLSSVLFLSFRDASRRIED